MTEFRTLVQESTRAENGAFYAPAFAVVIEGANLPRNVLRDVRELKYIDGLTEIDRFELTVNNWEPERLRYKFIGSDPDDSGLDRLFQPCAKKVQVKLGYADALQTMMVGNFTMMEPHFRADGAPTLTVTGLNVLHQLRRRPYTTAWVGRKPSWIARNLGTLRDDAGRPRFPADIVVDPNAEAKEPTLDYTAQTNQHDIDFLLNLARQHAYELVIEEPPNPQARRVLHFRPSSSVRPPVNYRLDWGRSLIEFEPTITSHNQVRSVTVNGWDRRAQRPIRETRTFEDPELRRLNRDLHEYVQCDPREEIVVERPVFTREQARSLALDILRDQAASVIKARGTTVGLPSLRAGSKVEIGSLGPVLNGEYLVTKTEHSLNDSGYVVRFDARREQLAGAAS